MPPPEFITQSPRARRETDLPRQNLSDLFAERSEPLCRRYEHFRISALRVRIGGSTGACEEAPSGKKEESRLA
jgi:hypothetical protein